MHLRLGFVDVVVAASASVAAQFLKVHDANFSSRPPNAGAKSIAKILLYVAAEKANNGVVNFARPYN